MTKASFPAMGWSKIAFKALINHIPGIEVFEPPEVNNEIVKWGSKYSPEFVCFPFKVTMGEFINMIEKYDVHTFFQCIDCGPCRYGFYAPVQERILKDLGYNVKIIPLQQDDLLTFEWAKTFYETSTNKDRFMTSFDLISAVRHFFIKAKYIEDINRYEGLIRCREVHKGDTTRAVKFLMKALDDENDMFKLHSFLDIVKQTFAKIPIKRELKPLRVMISGEIHVFMEQYVNMDLVKKLGDEGVEVHMGHSLYDWIMHKMHLNFKRKNLERYSKKYIPMDIGGEAIWVIGEYIQCQQEGYDGFVHVYPFTCMPEVTARGIIEGQTPDPFYLPIQFYSFDENTGFEGLRTRIEAFIDLMKTNRDNNPKFQNVYKEPPEIAELFDQPFKPRTIFDSIIDSVKPAVDFFKLLMKSESSSLSEVLPNGLKSSNKEDKTTSSVVKSN